MQVLPLALKLETTHKPAKSPTNRPQTAHKPPTNQLNIGQIKHKPASYEQKIRFLCYQKL